MLIKGIVGGVRVMENPSLAIESAGYWVLGCYKKKQNSSVQILNWRIEDVPISKSAKDSEKYIALNSLMSGLWDNLHKYSVWKWGVKN